MSFRFSMRACGQTLGVLLATLLSSAVLAQAMGTLTPYPQAKEYARHINPLEQGTLPISRPVKQAGAVKAKSQWQLPYEGAVSVLQYDHKTDDSPLLIARHYAGELKARGFELVTICEMPCTGPDGSTDSTHAWVHELDMTRSKMDPYHFGNRGLYFMGYKADAVAAIRVGQMGDRPVSTVKLVQSASLDLGPLKAWIAQQQAAPVSADLPPPPQAAAPSPLPPAGPPKIVDVAPNALAGWLEQHRHQRVVLQLTSFDANCGHCIRANPVFGALSSRAMPEGTVFVRTSWQPWKAVGQSAVARELQVSGLPSYMVLEAGRVTRRLTGNWDEPKLRQELLD